MEGGLTSHFSPNTTSLIRKLRKKLRQIEKLERLEQELTEEEEIKLDTKEELREELQNYLNQEENKMVTLTEKIERTSITYSKDVSNEIEGMGEEKKGYTISGKLINEESSDDELHGNGQSEYDEDFYCSHQTNVQNNGNENNGSENKEDKKTNGNGVCHDDTDPEKVACESVDNTVHKNNINATNDEDAEGDTYGEEEEGNENRSQAQTPIQLTITKRSLRQRNRGCHTSPLDSPDDSALLVHNTSEDVKSLFSDLKMTIKLLEGHYQGVCSVDMYGDYVVSGGRDTTVKLWSSSCTEELKSLGGHTATVTSVKFMKDKKYTTYPNAISGSYDCSLRVWDIENGTQTKCIYVYSPVVCLDYSDGNVAIGTEGGKVEVYNVDTGDQLLSVKTHDDHVSAVKLLSDNKVACGSTDGILKIFNISIAEIDPFYALDPLKVSIKQASEMENNSQSKTSTLSMSKITCITCWEDLVIYGDEGFNIKVLDHEQGKVTKVRSNLQEFCPTESLCVASVQGHDCLFSVGSDIDMGDAYINIRSLPDLKYLGTIRDSHNNTGTIMTFSIEEVDSCVRLVTGGEQLRVWDQLPRRAKKRKSAMEDDCLIPCKFICKYTEPRESEPDSESDESSQSKASTDKEASSKLESSQRWCSIL